MPPYQFCMKGRRFAVYFISRVLRRWCSSSSPLRWCLFLLSMKSIFEHHSTNFQVYLIVILYIDIKYQICFDNINKVFCLQSCFTWYVFIYIFHDVEMAKNCFYCKWKLNGKVFFISYYLFSGFLIHRTRRYTFFLVFYYRFKHEIISIWLFQSIYVTNLIYIWHAN